MPKTGNYGVGMKTMSWISYDPNEPDDLKALRKSEDRKQKMGWFIWDRVADYYQEILENAGLVPLGIEGREYTWKQVDAWEGIREYHLEAIAAEYLREYHYFQIGIKQLENGTLQAHEQHSLFDHLFEMGQIYERQFWRAGIDPISGKVREELAIGKRNQELATSKAAAARHKSASENEPEWWDHARIRAKEIHERRPDLSRSAIASWIANEVRRSERQVRDVIKPVC